MGGLVLNMQYLYQSIIRLYCTFLSSLLERGQLSHGDRPRQLMGLPKNKTAFKKQVAKLICNLI